jgi:hypothetical protein
MINTLWAAVLGCALVACGAGSPSQHNPLRIGSVSTVVKALTSRGTLTRVSVTLAPANVTQGLTYNAIDGTFTGTLVVPVGSQTVAATAYIGTTVVGTGSALVTVTGDGSATAFIESLRLTTDRRSVTATRGLE